MAELRVVGLIAKEGIGLTNKGVIGITPLNVAQELFARSGQVDQIELVVDQSIADNSDALVALQEKIEAHLGREFDVAHPASRGELVTDSLQTYQQGLNFFSVITLFVGSFLIYNAFAMTVVERTREIGMLRAVAFIPALQAARISPLQALQVQAHVDEKRWFVVGLKFGPLTVLAALLILYYVPFRRQIAFLVGSNAIFVLLLGATLCIPILTRPLERITRPFIIFAFGNEGRLGSSNINRADVANKFNLGVGDFVTLETKRGRHAFRVVAVVIDFGAGETTTVTGSWKDLRRYFGINDVSSFAVRLEDGVSLSAVADKIENDIGHGQNLSVESKQEFEEKIHRLSAEAFSLFDVLGLIGLVVAALGVINTMMMNVLERTRELGGLRSLGMSRKQVRILCDRS